MDHLPLAHAGCFGPPVARADQVFADLMGGSIAPMGELFGPRLTNRANQFKAQYRRSVMHSVDPQAVHWTEPRADAERRTSVSA
jgi:hypothetical protein